MISTSSTTKAQFQIEGIRWCYFTLWYHIIVLTDGQPYASRNERLEIKKNEDDLEAPKHAPCTNPEMMFKKKNGSVSLTF